MLPLALGIGEAKIDPLDLLVLDHLENVGRLVRHVCLPSLGPEPQTRFSVELRNVQVQVAPSGRAAGRSAGVPLPLFQNSPEAAVAQAVARAEKWRGGIRRRPHPA